MRRWSFAIVIRRFRALAATGTTDNTLDDLIEALAGEVRLKPEHTTTAPGYL